MRHDGETRARARAFESVRVSLSYLCVKKSLSLWLILIVLPFSYPILAVQRRRADVFPKTSCMRQLQLIPPVHRWYTVKVFRVFHVFHSFKANFTPPSTRAPPPGARSWP